MASTGLLAPAALGFRVGRRGQPSVSVSICRVAVLGRSTLPLTFESKLEVRGSDVFGKQRNTQILVYLPVTYVPGGTSSKAKTLGLSTPVASTWIVNTCSLRTWVRAADLHAGHA